jgi:undecaprenyl-diphosphatase
LVALLVLVGGSWAFIELADEVNAGTTEQFDRAVLLALRNPADQADPIGPGWVEEAVRDITALGSGILLTILAGGAVGYLWLSRRPALAWLIILTVTGSLLLNSVLKDQFDRPRPDLIAHGVTIYHTSFPSGHSMGAAATYLTLGVILARAQSRRRLQLYFLALAIGLTVAVGLSRLYLGLHWPTDVLAGWTAGALWALLCGLFVRWRYRRST